MAVLLFSGLKNKDQEKWNIEKIYNCSYFFLCLRLETLHQQYILLLFVLQTKTNLLLTVSDIQFCKREKKSFMSDTIKGELSPGSFKKPEITVQRQMVPEIKIEHLLYYVSVIQLYQMQLLFSLLLFFLGDCGGKTRFGRGPEIC